MSIKVEHWAGHDIRFVEVMVEGELEWCAVAKDVAEALDYYNTYSLTRRIRKDELYTAKVNVDDVGLRYHAVLTELGLYEAILCSQKEEAEELTTWVMDMLTELRKSYGLESYQVFTLVQEEFRAEFGSVEDFIQEQVDKLKR